MRQKGLVLAVRAYTLRQDKARMSRRKRDKTPERWPRAVLVFDTETTVDASQRLVFGSYRYCRWTEQRELSCAEEGLFHADDLGMRDPGALRQLVAYVSTHGADVAAGFDNRLHLYTRSDFVEEVLWPALNAGALVVGFNVPFDLSRLAVHCGEARSAFRGGFSFRLWENRTPGARSRELPTGRASASSTSIAGAPSSR